MSQAPDKNFRTPKRGFVNAELEGGLTPTLGMLESLTDVMVGI
jgi:hypothetical protein